MDHEGILNRPLTKRLSVSSQKIIHFTVMPLQFLALITSLVAQLCYFSRAWDRTVVLQLSESPPSSPTICRRWFFIRRWRPEIIFCKTTDRHFCVTRMNKVLKFYLNARNYGHRFIGKASRSIVTKCSVKVAHPASYCFPSTFPGSPVGPGWRWWPRLGRPGSASWVLLRISSLKNHQMCNSREAILGK